MSFSKLFFSFMQEVRGHNSRERAASFEVYPHRKGGCSRSGPGMAVGKRMEGLPRKYLSRSSRSKGLYTPAGMGNRRQVRPFDWGQVGFSPQLFFVFFDFPHAPGDAFPLASVS